MSARSIRRSHERVLVKDRRRTVRRAKRASIAAGAALGATVMFAPAAEAATFEVNTLNDAPADGCTTDPDGCTLRDAVAEANAAGGDDVVTFASDLSGTITLTQGELYVGSSGALTVTDPGPGEITVSGGDASRIFRIDGDLLTVDQLELVDGSAQYGGAILAADDSDVTLTGSSLTGNEAVYAGGAVAMQYGDLVVSDSVISGNSAISGDFSEGRGGGIFLGSDFESKYGAGAEIVDSEVSGNTASYSGGGLFGGKYTDLEVIDSEFSSNDTTETGGGISFSGTNAEVSGSEITGNTAVGPGGGVFIKYAEFEMADSTVTGNDAGAGAGIMLEGKYGFNNASLSAFISQSTIEGNTATYTGGGIEVDDVGDNGEVFIGQSTISGNEAGERGGGLAIEDEIEGPFEINNSTVSGNTAPFGGGVSIDDHYYEPPAEETRREVPEGSDGSLLFSNDTIADNTATEQGGGIYLGYYIYYNDETEEEVALSSTVPLSSTIVADNTGGDLAKSTVSDNGGFTLEYSLVETPGTAPVTQDPAGSSILGTDPQLGNLADNGGPTLTHLPADTSPAIDQGVDNETARDQRGERRSVDLEPDNNPANDPTDIGSVEIQTGAPPVEPETRPLTAEEIPASCELTLATAGLALGGTDGGQTIVGSDQDDVLRGFGGADTVIGKAGDDCLTGDDDIDTIRGKSGDDLGLGGDDIDFMKGNGGDDLFRGNGGDDRIKLASGNDNGSGGGGDDNIAAGNGEDRIKGNAGDDRMFGNDGNDVIKGGSGDDVIFGGGGVNDIDCGTGDDKVIVNGKKDEIAANCETVKVRGADKDK